MANPFLRIRNVVVNDVVVGNQFKQYVASAPTGDVLVGWNQPGYLLQTFDAGGIALSGEIPTSSGFAAWLDDGSYAVAQFSGTSASVQRYSRTGTLLDTSSVISAAAIDGVANLGHGHILLSYRSSSDANVHVGRIFDTSLDPVGESFALLSGQSMSSFAGLADGHFVESKGGDFQFYNADGTTNLSADHTGGDFGDVAALPGGGFVETFSLLTGTNGAAFDGSSYGIFFQFLAADGGQASPLLLANTTTLGEQSYSRVEVLDDRFLLVTWGPEAIHGQLFTMDGRKVGSELLLDSDGGFFGWKGQRWGWSIDSTTDAGFVSAQVVGSESNTDIELSYWQVDRANILIGTSAPETFSGGGTADRIMIGYGGNDVYSVDSAGDEVQEIAGEGSDRIRAGVDYTLGTGQSVEFLQADDDGGTAALALTGNALPQNITGNGGANRLDGGGGADVLAGLAGNDLYIIRNAADEARENAGEGTDRVYATVDWKLGAGQSVELLTMISNTATDSISLEGNELSQYLYGNYGNNALDGGGGGDVMSGFLGNDRYIVRSSADRILENAGEGNDALVAFASYVLAAGQSVETLTTSNSAGTEAIDLSGNELVQTITGNDGNNVLRSGGGADILSGRAGDDTYHITLEAVIQEGAGGGYDRLFVSGSSYTLGALEIEILTPEDEFGIDPYNFTGNGFAQYVYGNDGSNLLDGAGGGDVLVGRGGDDQLFVRSAADQIREDANDGSDRVFAFTSWQLNAGAQVEKIATDNNLGTGAINLTGNEFAQYVYGNAGSNVVGGGGGRDVLNGLGGADKFLFNTALNTTFTGSFASLGETANVDRIDDFAADDKIALSSALFGLTPGTLSAGAFALGTTASEADDRILYDAATGALLFDADGAGGAAAQLFAFINGPFNMDSSYFVVV